MKLALSILVSVTLNQQLTSQISTDDCIRENLFEDIVSKTIDREAWSSYKINNPEINYAEQAEQYRREFINADTDQKLARVIFKLSNLRHDRHLNISSIASGLSYSNRDDETVIRFYPDFSKSLHNYFVADFSSSETVPTSISIGDELISVNDIPIRQYFRMLEPYIRYSTNNDLRWEMAEKLSKYQSLFDPQLYRDIVDGKRFVKYTFRRKSDKGIYSEELEFVDDEDQSWQGICNPKFENYTRVIENTNFELYISDDSDQILLLNWLDLNNSVLDNDIDQLLDYAEDNDLLSNGIILYAPFSSGGSGSPKVVQLFSKRKFKTTFGNVRVSDITERFANSQGGKIKDWIDSAISDGLDYTSNEPFKLRYFDEGEDGLMEPNDRSFSGSKIGVFSSQGGSNLDQMMAMIVDNQIMYTIGYPTGGYSNTWEWREVIECPDSGDRLLRYMWNIGHTIRPNGEVLEANPAMPDELIDLNNENCETYWDDLVSRSRDLLKGAFNGKVKSYNWTEGWTNIEFFEVEGKTYMLRAKAKGRGNSGNNVHIERINSDGSIGGRVMSDNWTEGWTNIEFFEVEGKTYMLRAKAKGRGNSGNNVHIERINSDGSIGGRVMSDNWTEGWTSIEFFNIEKNTFALQVKKSGKGKSGFNAHVKRVNSDGSIGKIFKSYNWTEGWDSFKFYNSKGNDFMLQAKSRGRGSSGKNVHIRRVN